MDPTLQKWLIGALGGGAAGAGIGSFLSSRNKIKGETKKQRRKRILTQALLGGGLGAGVGSLPAGWDVLKGESSSNPSVDFKKSPLSDSPGLGPDKPKGFLDTLGKHFGEAGMPFIGDGDMTLGAHIDSVGTGAALTSAGGGLAGLLTPNKHFDAWRDAVNSQKTVNLKSLLQNVGDDIASDTRGSMSSLSGSNPAQNSIKQTLNKLLNQNSGNNIRGRDLASAIRSTVGMNESLRQGYNGAPLPGHLSSSHAGVLQRLSEKINPGGGVTSNLKIYNALRGRGLDGAGSPGVLGHAEVSKMMRDSGLGTGGKHGLYRALSKLGLGRPHGGAPNKSMFRALTSKGMRGGLWSALPFAGAKLYDSVLAADNPEKSRMGQAYTGAMLRNALDTLKAQGVQKPTSHDVHNLLTTHADTADNTDTHLGLDLINAWMDSDTNEGSYFKDTADFQNVVRKGLPLYKEQY